MKQDARQLGYTGRVPGEVSRNDWYTPVRLLTRVRKVLGTIDLDPASSELANKRVGARRFFTEQTNALGGDSSWRCRTCFMNPPYGRPLLGHFIRRFHWAWLTGEIQCQAIVLTNNVTETLSGQLLLESAAAVCFPRGRIAFETFDGKAVSGNTKGQMLTYFGDRAGAARFGRVFEDMGVLYLAAGLT